MSLILGINLLRKIYLVSDTRVTYSGSRCEDNQLKFAEINLRNSLVAAGNAHQAAFITTKVKERISPNASISELIEFLDKNKEGLAREYLDAFCHPCLSVFIITGYNNFYGKKTESTVLGRVMSGELVARGNGSSMRQSVDREITSALITAIRNKGSLNRGDKIDVNVPNSRMISFEFDTKNSKFAINEVDCCQYAIFHPGYSEKTLPVPDELLSFLEFRSVSGKSVEDVLYEDAEVLYNFVTRTARSENFWEVGGHIFVTLQSNGGGALFPTGELATVKDNNLVYSGKIEARGEGIFYELPSGDSGVYKKLESVMGKESKISLDD